MNPKAFHSWIATVVFSAVLVSYIGILPTAAQNSSSYRLCIPRKYLSLCEEMRKDGNPDKQKIQCIAGSDKVDCISKIVKDEADFVPLEPEEIYVAHRFKPKAFSIITEIRSVEFAKRDYRYEPVAVIRKSSGISSISDLRGKRSCHTGFGRNAGWKIPFSHLMDKKELSKLCNDVNAPTPERDIYAVSNYFSAACAPGTWIPEKTKDHDLKKRYPNLCELCEDPAKCERDDKYGGYEGALKCLTVRNADVAWTKMDSVVSYFKLKNPQPDPSASDYAFLCWDGSSVPLTSPDPCSWAKRPWRAFVASNRLPTASIDDLQQQITHFRSIGVEQGKTLNIIPEWLSKVLEFDSAKDPSEISVEFHIPSNEAKLTPPSVYLGRKNYTVTIEKPSCATSNSVKICVRSEIEEQKCRALKLAAMGRRILPTFSCVTGESNYDCIQKVKKGEADVVTLGAKDADWAKRNDGLKAILSELELMGSGKSGGGGESGPFRYALGVIKAETGKNYRNISDLRGKRSCHGSVKSLAGWNAAITTLRDTREIGGQTCGLTVEMGRYFGNRSCVPGVLGLGMDWLPKSFCSLCAGDGTESGKPLTPETQCAGNEAERYFGDVGALRCLSDGTADIAFTDHVELRNSLSQLQLKEEDLMLLCPKGEVHVMDIEHFERCNWGKIPTRKVMARGDDESAVQREDARLTLLKASDTFAPGSKNDGNLIFNLFGPYFENKDLLFQDTSVGLCDEDTAVNSGHIDTAYFDKLISDFDYCTTSSSPRSLASTLLAIVMSIFVSVRHWM